MLYNKMMSVIYPPDGRVQLDNEKRKYDFTWRGRGYIFLLPPHPPTWSRTYVRLFWPMCSRWWWRKHADFIWCMGAWPPPSIDWVAHARYHSPKQFSILIIISNLNVKSEFQGKSCHHILDVGSGDVHCLDLAWHLVVGGSSAGPPPTDWVVHARYHLPMLN